MRYCVFCFIVTSACIVNRTLFILQVVALTKAFVPLNRPEVEEGGAQLPVEESRT